MTTHKKRMLLAAILGTAFALPAISVRADEFGSNTILYEDDAWYDVSEWFDGNDYNPTDEAIGRWDDEIWHYTDNLTSTDTDNDWNAYGDYGYRTGNESDWFYDYYDDGYSDWGNTYSSNYYDIDNDGLYDAYAFYTDTDRDGVYEDVDYYTFNTDADNESQQDTKRQAHSQQKEMKSTLTKTSGTVQATKSVQVRDRNHVVAMIKGGNGATMPIDLGPTENAKVSEGDQLNAKGRVVKVGDKSVFIATEASTNSGTLAIDRNGKSYGGTVEKMMTINVKGVDRQLAKVNTKNGKTMMVDLGPTKNLDTELKNGAQITVRGVPVKVNDRVVLMARELTRDDKKTEIDRQIARSNS